MKYFLLALLFIATPLMAVNYSNSNTGHMQFKCKTELVAGEPQYFTFEVGLSAFPANSLGHPDGLCFNEVNFEGEKAVWVAQCYNVWQYEE